MKNGRLYLWRGRALVLGGEIGSKPHRHHALQLTVALQGSFTLHDEGGVQHGCQATVQWPGQLHHIQASGVLAYLFFDPGQRALSAWRGCERVLAAAAPLAELQACWQAPQSAALADRAVQHWLEAWLPGFQSAAQFDPRIARALDLLQQQPVLDGKALAAQLALSPSRFAHLFSQHTGQPLRRYQLWMRLLAAVDLLAAGGNLTEAAHQAGFADLAHMSREFHRTFGVVPSTLRQMAILRFADAG